MTSVLYPADTSPALAAAFNGRDLHAVVLRGGRSLGSAQHWRDLKHAQFVL